MSRRVISSISSYGNAVDTPSCKVASHKDTMLYIAVMMPKMIHI